MDKLFFDFLSEFLQEHGYDILYDAAKFKALISDHAKGEFKDEIRLIYQMILSNYPKRILEATEPDLYGEVSRTLLGQLKKEFFLDDETALQVIQGLFGILKGYTVVSLPERIDAGTQRILTSLLNAGPGLKQYLEIMDLFPRVDVSKDRHFQARFNDFYRVRHPQRDFYEGYYRFMETHKENAPSFIDTLRFLYEGYGRLDAAFASKLLATINPNLPVWDQFVLRHIGLEAPPRELGRETRMQMADAVYARIIHWYRDFLLTDTSRDWIQLFDQCYPGVNITPLKKIDLIIWQMRD